MSYSTRPYRPVSERYISPVDDMFEAFNRFNEAFHNAMMPRYGERVWDRPYAERLPYSHSDYERPERVDEKLQEKGVGKEKPQEKSVQDNLITPKSVDKEMRRQPLSVNFLQRPIMDVLETFEDPFFKSNWETHSTFNRAHKILDELVSKGKPNLKLTKHDELLKVPDEFEEVYREFGSKGGNVTGTSYQTSNITKDGKTVTVVRKSKLNPDGSLSTKVSQHFDDGLGHRDTKSRKKTINFKTGAVSYKTKDEPTLKAGKEPSMIKSAETAETQKPIEITDCQAHKEQEKASKTVTGN